MDAVPGRAMAATGELHPGNVKVKKVKLKRTPRRKKSNPIVNNGSGGSSTAA
jgi:hypothetical protein